MIFRVHVFSIIHLGSSVFIDILVFKHYERSQSKLFQVFKYKCIEKSWHFLPPLM